jgi:hypothetical protein
MVTAPAKSMPIHPTIRDGGSDRNAEDFPQGRECPFNGGFTVGI